MASVVSEEGSKREESSPGSADREKIRVVVTGGTVGRGGGGGGGGGGVQPMPCCASAAQQLPHTTWMHNVPGLCLASGLLGRSVLAEFVRHKDQYAVVGTAFSRATQSLRRVDLCNPEELTSFLKAQRPQVIIHCAAERRPDKVEGDAAGTAKLNGRFTRAGLSLVPHTAASRGTACINSVSDVSDCTSGQRTSGMGAVHQYRLCF